MAQKCCSSEPRAAWRNRLVPAAGFPLATDEGRRIQSGQPGDPDEDHARSAARNVDRAAIAQRISARRDDRSRRIRFRSGDAGGASCKHIPTLAFEPNVVPGFANRVVARCVTAAAVHSSEPPSISAMRGHRGSGARRRFSRFPEAYRRTHRRLCWSSVAARARAPSIRR